MRKRFIHYVIIAFLVVIAYLPTFTGDFIFDDQTLIRDNPYITQLQSLSSYLSQEDGIADPRDKGIFHTGYYRPLINITYFIDYKLWGMKATGFRTTNLILHLITCFILYELLLHLTGYRQGAFWAALLFALHPVHTESLSMIVSRNNILATLFILVSLYGYLNWWKKESPVLLAVSLIAFVGAVFSKEFGLMALPIFFLCQRLLVKENNLRREMESYVPYMIIVGVYLFLRKAVVSAPFIIPDDVGMRLYFVPYLLSYNLKLIFIPYNLHSFSVVYPPSLLSGMALCSFLFVLCLAVLWYFLRKERLLFFSGIAFTLTLLPVLNCVAKVSVSLIAMRWLYLPMSFVALGVAWLLAKTGGDHKRILRIILMAIAVYFTAYSYTLNTHLWHDNKTFLKQEVLHFNNDLYAGDFAEMMLTEKQYREAERYFLLSLEKYPRQVLNYINYGALLIETGRSREALAILERARSLPMIHKDRSSWNNNMGGALTLIGDYDQAHKYFLQSLVMDPQNHLIHRNLAVLLLREGRASDAAQRLKIAERLKLGK
ncbi:MAG: hypothetical protein NTV58_00730 [Deltaproteobacteria bacterium]|nr:hypothetical protein [Deltaproteobacteria bacterium]